MVIFVIFCFFGGAYLACSTAERQQIPVTFSIFAAFLACLAAERQPIRTTSSIFAAFLPTTAMEKQPNH